MILSDYIKALQLLEASGHGNLIVKVDDWSEEYGHPSEEQAEIIVVVGRNARHYQIWTGDENRDAPPFICIAARDYFRR